MKESWAYCVLCMVMRRGRPAHLVLPCHVRLWLMLTISAHLAGGRGVLLWCVYIGKHNKPVNVSCKTTMTLIFAATGL